MDFKNWLNEAQVQTKDIGSAIEKTLEFKIPGTWDFDSSPHQWDRPHDAMRVSGTLKNHKTPGPTNYFFLSCYAIMETPISTYDSITGNTSMRIVASFHYVEAPGSVKKLGERSRSITPPRSSGSWGKHDGTALKTPYELANWVQTLIDEYGKDDDDRDDPEESPTVDPHLVGVG